MFFLVVVQGMDPQGDKEGPVQLAELVTLEMPSFTYSQDGEFVFQGCIQVIAVEFLEHIVDCHIAHTFSLLFE
jgi:hypothetical protein